MGSDYFCNHRFSDECRSNRMGSLVLTQPVQLKYYQSFRAIRELIESSDRHSSPLRPSDITIAFHPANQPIPNHKDCHKVEVGELWRSLP